MTEALTNQSFIALALLAATSLVAAFFAYLYNLKRRPYLLYWTLGWGVVALSYLGPVLFPIPSTGLLKTAIGQSLYAAAGIFFFLGAQLYAQRPLWRVPAAIAGGVLVLWAGANSLGWLSIPLIFPAAAIFLGVTYLFWQESRRQETLADWLLAISFAVWAMAGLIFDILGSTSYFRGVNFQTAAAAPATFVAMLMVMALYEEEKRRVERNMLALSNLNLATSSFVGGEIQRMLSQALDRVLGVVRLPAGALFLHHGDPQGPTSVVAVGLNDNFCRTAQEQGLDDYLVGLVSRLGGLLGFRDLRNDDTVAALEREEPIRRFRQLALSQGLRSIVAISLQAKEQAFGVLLLGTPDSRRFTPAEYRLLLALGHQIGMAVENSYLIQQTSRRSEE
ncbi:MAG: GAF domain-containing protein, partial [Candidatus Acidiferrum sp.]